MHDIYHSISRISDPVAYKWTSRFSQTNNGVWTREQGMKRVLMCGSTFQKTWVESEEVILIDSVRHWFSVWPQSVWNTPLYRARLWSNLTTFDFPSFHPRNDLQKSHLPVHSSRDRTNCSQQNPEWQLLSVYIWRNVHSLHVASIFPTPLYRQCLCHTKRRQPMTLCASRSLLTNRFNYFTWSLAKRAIGGLPESCQVNYLFLAGNIREKTNSKGRWLFDV